MRRASGIPTLLLGLMVLGGCGAGTRKASLAWQTVPLTTDADFNGIWFADDRHGWVVGGGYDIEGGIVGRTRDGGQTWEYASGLISGWRGARHTGFTAVQFFDSLSGCTVASGGQIFLTSDGGANWRLVRHGGGEALSDLHFIDRYRGWAVGGAGVLSTVDGGESWHWAVRSLSENGYLGGTAIHFIDSGTGWMADQREVWKTLDGGETWAAAPLPLAPGENPHLYDLDFPDPQHGWVVGEDATILATADGGSTWVRQANGIPKPKPRPLHIVHRVGAVDTFDIEGPVPGLLLTAVRFLDATHGWTVGFFPTEGRSLILSTEDGGATWHEEGQAPGEELRALFMTREGRGWTLGDRVREGSQSLLRRPAPTL